MLDQIDLRGADPGTVSHFSLGVAMLTPQEAKSGADKCFHNTGLITWVSRLLTN